MGKQNEHSLHYRLSIHGRVAHHDAKTLDTCIYNIDPQVFMKREELATALERSNFESKRVC
jgi:hypothetical protein